MTEKKVSDGTNQGVGKLPDANLGLLDKHGEAWTKPRLPVLRERLLTNPHVHFREYPPSRGHYNERENYSYQDIIAENMQIAVAPKKPIFNGQELETFIESLTGDLRLGWNQRPYLSNEGNFILGQLEFKDLVGTVKKTINTTTDIAINTPEPEVLEKTGITVGKVEEKEEQNFNTFRLVTLIVYPNIASANVAYDYNVGLHNGTVPHNKTHMMASHHLTPQLLKIYKDSANYDFSLTEVNRLLEQKRLGAKIKEIFHSGK